MEDINTRVKNLLVSEAYGNIPYDALEIPAGETDKSIRDIVREFFLGHREFWGQTGSDEFLMNRVIEIRKAIPSDKPVHVFYGNYMRRPGPIMPISEHVCLVSFPIENQNDVAQMQLPEGIQQKIFSNLPNCKVVYYHNHESTREDCYVARFKSVLERGSLTFRMHKEFDETELKSQLTFAAVPQDIVDYLIAQLKTITAASSETICITPLNGHSWGPGATIRKKDASPDTEGVFELFNIDEMPKQYREMTQNYFEDPGSIRIRFVDTPKSSWQIWALEGSPGEGFCQTALRISSWILTLGILPLLAWLFKPGPSD